jgi:hypothetical protein
MKWNSRHLESHSTENLQLLSKYQNLRLSKEWLLMKSNITLTKYRFNISELAHGISKCKSKMIFFHDFEISRFHDKQNMKSHLSILKLKVLRALRLLYKCHPNHLPALR